MSVRRFFVLAAIGVVLTATWLVPRHYWAIGWQISTRSFASPPGSVLDPHQQPSEWSDRLISAAEGQIGKTVKYDPSYVRLAFPGGDVPRERGVCTDVVIRALRDAHGIDLQLMVNRDMKRGFRFYPRNWGLSRPDTNIDHRRVPNLQRFFVRKGADLPVSNDAADYRPGDIVTWKLPGNLDHIGIVTGRPSRDGKRPLIVHNIGAGTRLQDILFSYEITGHFRLERANEIVSR
jgi:hypothetical protein